ncbi:serine hydrolase domain-containing protein [Mucilaginibacter auburnensis]|uniref:CubicO group peptidase (Beta-lactamase class C family) n=1 Tax=Mucilaginibacter auburnensis TaxID=1457233 RepID=A0A2H9VT00_9SPHI|nr:serine hydrolase [Mucilaginibacter auburnensis]PJJ83938.1 CubicO group peptidase (beta-lactamase class C family) [Mucilaginibacter auburnensis]
MRKNKPNGFTLIISLFILFNSACAQTPTGEAYVAEETKVQSSTYLFNNQKELIPLKKLAEKKIASIHFSHAYAAGFDSLLNNYAKVEAFNGADYLGSKSTEELSRDVKMFNTLILQLTENDLANTRITDFIKANQKLKDIVIAYFGKASQLTSLKDFKGALVYTQQASTVASFFVAQAIFGGVAITQKPTTSLTPQLTPGLASVTQQTRLQYTVPEEVGIRAENLADIDKIARDAIAQRATPGCVVLAVKDGKVIFNKAYGFHTYDATVQDKVTDIFDLASMTKISATTIAAMKLVDEGKLDINATVADYLPEAKNTPVKDVKVWEILTHQAGFIADIPTLEVVKPQDRSTDSSAAYPTKVNNRFYLVKDYFKNVMWPKMLRGPLKTRGQYVYSDVGMCVLQQIIENITSTNEAIYTQQQFYTPLGMQTTGYLPLYRFNKERIPPTEVDPKYRRDTLQGYVHDPTAALMGGIAGHAGLFGNAIDMATLYQMLLYGGTYGGEEYLKPATVKQFTARYSGNSRRGLGFDRWDPAKDKKYPSELASDQTYGHTGFTGTCVWVDPKYNLVYVFLSNRVYPDVSSKLNSLSIRGRIQDVIYRAIQKGM